MCPLSPFTRTKLFFFFPPSLIQETITALIYLPGIKCWWVPVSSGWHLYHQRSQSRGREKHWGKRGKKSCLHTQPTDVAELLSSLGCPLVSLRDAWWQRWGCESCAGLWGGGSAPLRVPCYGRARPGPCATVSSASSVSTPYALGHCREGTGGLSRVGLNYNQGIAHAKAAHCRRSHCSCNSCTVSYHVSPRLRMIAGNVLAVEFILLFHHWQTEAFKHLCLYKIFILDRCDSFDFRILVIFKYPLLCSWLTI